MLLILRYRSNSYHFNGTRFYSRCYLFSRKLHLHQFPLNYYLWIWHLIRFMKIFSVNLKLMHTQLFSHVRLFERQIKILNLICRRWLRARSFHSGFCLSVFVSDWFRILISTIGYLRTDSTGNDCLSSENDWQFCFG